MNTRIDRGRLLIGTYIVDTYARTEKHVRELKEAGIDMIVCLRSPSVDFLDLLQKYNIGCVLSGIVPGWWGGDGSNAGTMAEANPVAKYAEGAADFVDHPAVWMIDIGDEPSARDFGHYGRVCAAMEQLFPKQLPYLNLYPNYASVAENSGSQALNQLGTVNYEEHIREYVEKVCLPYISYDFYVYAMDVNGLGMMYDNFRIVSEACRRTGRDFWYIPQCNGRNECDFTSADQMRFQAYCALAYGAVAINWACWTAGWWNNNILDKNGNKTEQYGKLAEVNAELRAFGREYMNYRNVGTYLAGFENVGPVRSHPSLKTFSSLDFGYVRDLCVSPGSSIVVGEMTGRDDPSRRALLILNATDYTGKCADDAVVSFSTYNRDVRFLSSDGKGFGVMPDVRPADDGSGRTVYSFGLPCCRAVLVTVR